ncbi:hypothetical protein FSP39_003690 [Pinctada imbricata]|uniref:TRIM56 n=1 Tax=Pinctada imbricata TaxID=66713 RepID=A0AA88YMZ5_PINIB|nr:hypothetical protein FSP39_003690 [Pinctada imbricata]
MASSLDRITSCPICMDTMKTPKYFPCLHSFCEDCAKTHITRTFEPASNGVKCPVCREFVKKPKHTDVEKWKRNLPTNHILVSLIDTSEPVSGQLCTACARENENKSAYSWCINCSDALCKTCTSSHSKNQVSAKHKIVEIAEDWCQDKYFRQADVLCSVHSDQRIHVYCLDHSVGCCVKCAMLEHRQCGQFCSIENASDQMKQSTKVKEFEENLIEFKKWVELLVKSNYENLTTFNSDLSSMRKGVANIFRKMFDQLDDLKTKIMSDISDMEKKVRFEMKSEMLEMECTIQAIQNDIESFRASMKYDPPVKFLYKMDNLLRQESIIERNVNKHHEKLGEIRVQFDAKKELSKARKIIEEFGNAIGDEIERSFGNLAANTIPRSKVYTSGDFVGVALLENGHVLLSMYDKDRLELRDPLSQVSTLSSLSLPGSPYGVKMIDETEGVVAVSGHGLFFFKIKRNEIVQTSNIEINVNCDFAYHKSTYYVGCDEKITVYDSKHIFVRDITVENDIVEFIAVRNDTSLCYTVYKGHVLYCITTEGIPVFTYAHDKLQGTTGVTVDQIGHIYVCGFLSENIHQLSDDGKLLKIIIDSLPAAPWFISFVDKGDKAAIACVKKYFLYNVE